LVMVTLILTNHSRNGSGEAAEVVVKGRKTAERMPEAACKLRPLYGLKSPGELAASFSPCATFGDTIAGLHSLAGS